ncbi:MAG: iron ABC transporter substrate-binding protein [Burkholderiales bacterium]|nr:iron ABC transporter substrate-binding protein [Burkholderiales bacterium]
MPTTPFDSKRRRLLAAAAGLAAAPRTFAQSPREIRDATGRRIVLPARIERVYAAGPPASVLAFAVAPEKLIGWTTPFRPAERPYVAQRHADLPTLGRLTGRGNTANVEVVIAARPDLVFDYGAVTPTFASLAERVQQQTGIPYVLLDGSFDRMAASMREYGAIVGAEDRGAALALYAEQVLGDLARRIAAIPAAQRPRVYYGRGPRGLDTGLAGSINVESVERAGGVNVAAELGRGGLVQVSLEQVLRWDPQVVVTTDPNFFASVRTDPLWRSVAAVRDRRVHLAPAVPFGWIDFPPSVNRLVGLPWLARVFHPQAFRDDLRGTVRDFYARFYHRTPREAQLDDLLAGTPP